MKSNALAPAKINLGLHIVRRRSDGFHDIETVLLQIPWCDRVSVQLDTELRLTCTDPTLPSDERNLCIRAARALQAQADTRKGARIHLEKHLPYGAGLGGGSSDAAATLRLLAGVWDLPLDEQMLRDIALEIGSDVPFFLGPPAALAQSRGERLTPLVDEFGLSYAPPFAIAIVVPRIALSTAEAYALVRPKERMSSAPQLVELVRSNDLDRWRAELVNDFEESVLTRHSVIAATKQLLEDAGAAYVSLSGSGSAMYGMFAEDASARVAAENALNYGHRVWWGWLGPTRDYSPT